MADQLGGFGGGGASFAQRIFQGGVQSLSPAEADEMQREFAGVLRQQRAAQMDAMRLFFLQAQQARAEELPPLNQMEVFRRSENLLIQQLSPDQEREFLDAEYFTVKGSRTGKPYYVRAGTTFNVTDDDGVAYCGVPHGDARGRIPPHDCALASKLMLENDEMAYLRAANRQPDDSCRCENPRLAGQLQQENLRQIHQLQFTATEIQTNARHAEQFTVAPFRPDFTNND